MVPVGALHLVPEWSFSRFQVILRVRVKNCPLRSSLQSPKDFDSYPNGDKFWSVFLFSRFYGFGWLLGKRS